MVSCLSAVKLFDHLKLTEALNSQAQVPVYAYHASVSQLSHLVMSDSLQLHGLQHSRPPCSSPTPRACPNSCPLESVMPSNHLILCCPLLLTPSIFPSIMVFSNFSSSYQVAKVLEFQLEHHSFQRIFRTDFL